MKTFKKICTGVGLAALFAVIFQVLSASGTLAAGGPINGSAEWSQATYTMNQSSQVTVNLAGNDHDNINFNGSGGKYTADTNGTGVCSGTITFNSDQSLNSHPIKASVNVKFENSEGPTPTCANGGNGSYGGSVSITNNTSNGGNTAADTGPTTVTYNGTTYKQIGSSRAYGVDTNVGDCYGGSLITLGAIPTGPAASGSVTGTLLPTIGPSSTSGGGELSSQVSNFPSIPLSNAAGKCYYNSNADNGNHILLTVVGDGTATFAGCSKGDSSCQPNPAGNGNGGGGGGPTNSCEGSSNTGFEWIFCGVLRMFDSMTNTMTNIIESLLTFDVSTYLNTNVHAAWSVFKNISSAILVIILLVAVIAQAIGGGPLDAYTIRKILPRLIIAVILMQISWYMLIWTIELANDAGHGMRDLLCAPFGGYSTLNLDKLVGQLGIAAPAGGEIAIFTTAGIAFAFSGLTIGGVALIALSGVLSLIVGLLILLLREILIILCVILFPLAILAWILPGTQRYWKLWYDNFSKLLLLFPLIMGVIYAGRIFAHIAGTPGSSTTDHILAMFIVFVGYFAPYWFLPKTFKWGGQAFASASGATLNATKGMRAFPRKYVTGAAKENRERRAELRAARLADDPNNRRFSDRLLAGEFNIAKSRGHGGQLGAREMQFAKTLAAGEKESRESVPAQLLRSGYDSWRHGPALNERGERIMEGEAGYEINKLDANQAWLEGRTYAGITPDAALRGHAFDTLVQLGDPDRIRMARQNAEIPEEIWSKATARNFSQLNQIARYLTLSPDLSNLAVRQYTTQDDDTAQELVRQLQGNYIYNRETGGRVTQTPEQHRAALQRAADLAVDAQEPLIWVDLGQTKKQVISQIAAMAAAEGIVGVGASDRRRRGGPAPAPPPPPPPAPPEGPGPEDDEHGIDIDHDPGT